MTRDLEIVANAIARKMLPLVDIRDPEARAMFAGLGIALAICFRQATGKHEDSVGAIEVMRWALSIHVDKPRVTLQ